MGREWSQGLRSYLHPMLFASLYKLLHITNLDSIWFMVLLLHSLRQRQCKDTSPYPSRCVYCFIHFIRFARPALSHAVCELWSLHAGTTWQICQSSSGECPSQRHSKTLHCSPARWVALGLLLTNVPVALYTSLVHQRLRGCHGIPSRRGSKKPCRQHPLSDALPLDTLLFFLAQECAHAISGLLSQGSALAQAVATTPSCVPSRPLSTLLALVCSDVAGYVGEADQFMSEPLAFLSAKYEGDEKSRSPL